jgi:putative ABC transport system permease protein
VHLVQPLEGHLRRSLLERRLVLVVTLAFAGTALLLAAVGTYSLVSFRVAQRRREWALRAALGAAPPLLLRAVLRGALAPVGGGLAVGAALACVANWQWQLRGAAEATASPAAAAAALIALAGAATLASALPALRASRADAAPALRGEE